MRKISDLQTSSQLIIGFGVLIFLMLTLGVITWKQTNKMAEQTESLYNHVLQVRRSIGKFEAIVNLIQSKGRGLFLVNNVQKTEILISQIEVNKEEAFLQLDTLELKYTGPIDDIKVLRKEFIQWNKIREESIRMILHGYKQDAVNRHVTPESIGYVQHQKLMEKITVVDNFSRNKGNQFFTQFEQLKNQLLRRLLLFSIISLVFSIVFAFLIIKIINNPLKVITNAIQAFRTGNIASRSTYSSGNMFGKLSESFNEMADAIETDKIISKHIAEISDIMLSENDAHKFCDAVLKSLLERTNSQMGVVFLLNYDETLFEHFACLGMDSEGYKPFSAIHPEGELGLAVRSGKINHIKDISPESRFSFHTVSGRFKPREIITIPVINNRQTVAVISILSLYKYSELSLRLIENLFSTLTARMNGILAYKNMLELNEKLEEQNTELDAQKNELGTMTAELKERNAELEIQKHQLGEISRLKSNFLSNMSHELRTPLNSVIALSAVLNRRLAQKIAEEEYSYLGVIERNGKHLLELINDILDLSRIEAGKVEPEVISFNIKTLLNDVVAMIKPQADQKNILLTLNESFNDITIDSDYNKCFHIFQNIVGNAVKFTEKGKVEIYVSGNDEHAEVRISDTGIGISKADLTQIYNEFWQADGSNSRKFGGTGLGLSIVKKYADLLDCKIHVESEIGIGTVFTIHIPLTLNHKTQESKNLVQKTNQPSNSVTVKQYAVGKTILLVEDNFAMIIQMKDILEEVGYKVEIAGSGFEALHLLEKNIPDAMILDIMMPGMDGIELLNQIRTKAQTSNLPVLVLTAKLLSNEERKSIINNNIHQLIQKGKITRDSLLESVAVMTKNEEKATGLKTAVIPVKITEKAKLLAVEDNPDNMLALKALIGQHFEFIEAENGLEGINQALKYKPHIILMDIAMPQMNGIEALKEIRNNMFLKHIPVIAVTSSAMRGDKDYFLELGFNGYVSKPVNREILFEEIFKWIRTENL